MAGFGVSSPVPLIMLGMGPNPSLVTSGFTPLIVRAARVLRGGRAAYKKLISEYEERFKISAMIMTNNGREIINPVSNKLSRIFLENNINIKKSYAKELIWKRTKRPAVEVKNIHVEHKKSENFKVVASHKNVEAKKKDLKITAKRKINVKH